MDALGINILGKINSLMTAHIEVSWVHTGLFKEFTAFTALHLTSYLKVANSLNSPEFTIHDTVCAGNSESLLRGTCKLTKRSS